MYFSENLQGFNPVMMNYKIRRNNNWPVTMPARYSLEQLDHFFHYYFWWQKMEKTVWSCKATCQSSHGGSLAQCVRQPEHWSIDKYCYLHNSGFARPWSQILCNQLSGKQSIGDPVNVFLQAMSMKVICKSFLPQTIPNIWYIIAVVQW